MVAVVVAALCALWASPARCPGAATRCRAGRTRARERPQRPVPDHAGADAGPGRRRPVARPPRRSARGPRRRPQRRTELARLRRIHAISPADYRRYLGSFNAALGTVRRLSGTRAIELESVIQNLHAIAAAGELTPSRLPALFLTLDRNRQWWTTGPLLASGQRVEFAGSELVWEYYPGQGIELQELGSFGKADGLYTAGPLDYPRMRHLLAELIPLAAERAGGIAWEYYFSSTAASRRGRARCRRAPRSRRSRVPPSVRRHPLPERRPSGATDLQRPATARSQHRRLAGAWYLLYSFAPGATVVNGFLQTLIGLYDFAHAATTQAARLFAAGDAEARPRCPATTPAPGRCTSRARRTRSSTTSSSPASCRAVRPRPRGRLLHDRGPLRLLPEDAAGAAAADPAPAPAPRRRSVSALESLARRHRRPTRPDRVPHQRGFAYGADTFSIPALASRIYTIRLAATDLAGNFNRIVGTIEVSG